MMEMQKATVGLATWRRGRRQKGWATRFPGGTA
jgi:hypothetical protein